MFHRGFSTLGCVELSLDAAMALGAANGLSRMELRGLDGSLDLPTALVRSCGTPREASARMATAPVSIAALDTSWRLIGSGRPARQDLLSYAAWAEAVGARWLRVFDGGTTLARDELEAAAAWLAGWRELRESEGLRVDLMIETHDTLLDAARIGHFVAAMPGPAPSLLWDAHHTWRKGGEDPLVTWPAIRHHVVHVHVKDSLRTPDGSWRYTLPGDGDFPMLGLRQALAQDFAGTVCLEWERHWHPELPPLSAALEAADRRGWW